LPPPGNGPGELIFMRTSIPSVSQPAPNQATRKSLSLCLLPSFVVLAAALFAAPLLSGAQAPAAKAATTPPAQTPAHKPVHPHKRPGKAQPAAPADQEAQAPVKPVVPEAPHWPANDKPSDASVTWDSQGLRIEAENSSLQQILKDVSVATGAKVEGLTTDQRVFGDYGPGQAREVLSQLLDGSGYNVIMIGDQGEGTPRQIVLSSRNSTSAQAATPALPAAAGEEETEPEEQPQPESPGPPPNRHGTVRPPQ
jgi:hypothetical protein